MVETCAILTQERLGDKRQAQLAEFSKNVSRSNWETNAENRWKNPPQNLFLANTEKNC